MNKIIGWVARKFSKSIMKNYEFYNMDYRGIKNKYG
jgi:hypothetical protein